MKVFCQHCTRVRRGKMRIKWIFPTVVTKVVVIKLATIKHSPPATPLLGHVFAASHKNVASLQTARRMRKSTCSDLWSFFISTPEITEIQWGYYDYQLSKERWEFGESVLKFHLCCCHGQLAPFPGTTCQPLVSLAAKRRKLQATI